MSTERNNGYPRLLADIGGTNTRFALETAPRQFTQIEILPTRDHDTIESAIHAYLKPRGTIAAGLRHAAIGIANPVYEDRVHMTNNNWTFSIAQTRRALGLETFLVINDFTALAHALPYLPKEECEQIGGGAPDPRGPRALLGAGTGLGVSGLVPAGSSWAALAGEGGHASFSPVNETESRLWEFARGRFGHVSAERLLSGPGLMLSYECLRAGDGPPMRESADIVERGLAGADPVCQRVVAVFCDMLGTVAGDLALTLGARGGVFIGGGIVPRLGQAFAASGFRSRFEDKGRFRDYLGGIPVYVIHTGLPAFPGLSAALSSHLAVN